MLHICPRLRPLHLAPQEVVHREDLQRPPLPVGHRHAGKVLPHLKNEAAEAGPELSVGIKNFPELQQHLHNNLNNLYEQQPQQQELPQQNRIM